MNRTHKAISAALAGVCLALGAESARGAAVQDLVRLKGHERNVLTGMGIVIGLDGTGDTSKDSLITARPYARLFRSLGNLPASVDELAEADSYALVQVTLRVPPEGAREGDRFDVSIQTLYNAQSLAGGRLIVSMLRLPGPDDAQAPVYAFAEGMTILEGVNPRSGIVRDGGQMMLDIRTNPVGPGGALELVINEEYAGFPVATTIADAINDEFLLDGYADIAVVMDAKNIRVMVPPADRERAASFISTLMTIPIDSTLIQIRARIVINEAQGIIAVTGAVEIGPVAVTHRGLSITSITPEPQPSAAIPIARTTRWAGLDTTDRRARASTRLIDLLDAFDRLNVSTADQIAIIYELKRTGVLHAEIVHQ